jgi:hypothetical protein
MRLLMDSVFRQAQMPIAPTTIASVVPIQRRGVARDDVAMRHRFPRLPGGAPQPGSVGCDSQVHFDTLRIRSIARLVRRRYEIPRV